MSPGTRAHTNASSWVARARADFVSKPACDKDEKLHLVPSTAHRLREFEAVPDPQFSPCLLLDERDFPYFFTAAPTHDATRVAIGLGDDRDPQIVNKAALQMAAKRLLELAAAMHDDASLANPDLPYAYT